MNVTATISTRGRYFDTLPLCLNAIATQTVTPTELIIYDDNTEKKYLPDHAIYQNIFARLNNAGIFWHVEPGTGEGQVKNHQRALLEARNEFIWRLDDDNIPEPNVLEKLLSTMMEDEKTGAVGGLVLDPKNNNTYDPLASNKIRDIFQGKNEQWSYRFSHEKIPVDHLYSSFLFRKSATQGYDMNLSRVGHREETIFTYEMKRAGWSLWINPKCITWHYTFPTGGIRDNTRMEMWQSDEKHFHLLLQKWGVKIREPFFAVLDAGIGDHYAFKSILPKIYKAYEEKAGGIFIIAVCYPEVFASEKRLTLISIADAKRSFGKIDQWNVYHWMIERQWKSSLTNAFEKMYLPQY